MDNERRSLLIGNYREGHGAIMSALARVARDAFDRAPAGEWSARQIVHHLADTELFRSVRLRQLISEDDPVIQAFDELRLEERAHYGRPTELSLAVFDTSVLSNLELLSLLSEDDWARTGTHTEVGLFTMEMWLERAAEHLQDHSAQLNKTLAANFRKG